MHNIGRMRLETPSETGSIESGPFETEQFDSSPAEAFSYEDASEVLGETEQLELASELLEAESEADLDRVLRDLISSVCRTIGKLISSPEAKAIGGILKGAAKRILSGIGRGTDAAARDFGLELEGLSSEDREFEIARHYVNFAGEVIRNMALAPSSADASTAAAAAAVEAAKRYAPGLLRSQAEAETSSYLERLHPRAGLPPEYRYGVRRGRDRVWP
jgi:hypothetical protein